jgi:hypothetical protein
LTTSVVPSFDIWAYIDQIRNQVATNDPTLLTTGSGQVFHYTSLSTLEAATSGEPAGPSVFKCLRASSVAFMNDSEEYKYGHNLIASELKVMLDSATGLLKKVLVEIEQLTNAMQPYVYCVCFSLLDDDLSQWRGYGDMGRGCTIGVDRAILEQHVAGIGCWVTYDADLQKSLASGLISDYVQTMEALLGKSRKAIGAVARTFANLFPSLCMLFKHSAFRAEREYRIIYSPTGPSPSRKQHFRAAGSKIIPYVELD